MFYSLASFYLAMKAFFLFSLVRAQIKFEPLQKHFLFLAILYTLGMAFLSYIFLLSPQQNPDIRAWGIWLAKLLGLTIVYFWLLRRFDEGPLFWIIMLGGGAFLIWF